jgi:phosphate transport system permease protein
MTQFIKIGGVVVISAVLGIFAFILIQIVPLFRGAQIDEEPAVSLPPSNYVAMGVDEWSVLPFFVRADGKVLFADLTAGGRITEADPGIGALMTTAGTPDRFSAVSYDPRHQELIFATAGGFFSIVPIRYSVDYATGSSTITQHLVPTEFVPLGTPGAPIHSISSGDSGDSKLIAAIQQSGDQVQVHATRLVRKRSLMGSGKLVPDRSYDLTPLASGKPVQILVSSAGDGVVLQNVDGTIDYLFRTGDAFERRQTFKPFEDRPDASIASLDFLFGDVSLVATCVDGTNRIFSLFRAPSANERTFGLTKEFPPLPSGASFFNASLRNKAFLIGNSDTASLRHGTTEAIRWQEKLPFQIRDGMIGGKYNRLLLLDTDSRLHVYRLNDPHPETSWKALFGKVWYEGYAAPSYEWQSTGATDDFEPKLSLVPLIIGTFKGTLYAMLFAIPIALLAAIYTSQFLHPEFKGFIKPVMEIMASLPSVVLGFLAALWLAPLLETRVPSLICIALLAPAVAWVIGYGWSGLPIRKRRFIPAGYEFFVFLPIMLATLYFGWMLGPVLEKSLFVVTTESGRKVADFRLWWPAVTGAPYEQRNSLVVGFVMGFAVIPIIFTIAEDALSNVPSALRSGSLALGASRWQTAIRVVLPTASAGVFSALMIGLGRAVGETMIVVMATGNTPVLDFNLFSGMRTLSANIAVELPEAPHHGTLYRTLFLGAMLLFLLTFLVNTAAELLRQHLREKYKTI